MITLERRDHQVKAFADELDLSPQKLIQDAGRETWDIGRWKPFECLRHETTSLIGSIGVAILLYLRFSGQLCPA